MDLKNKKILVTGGGGFLGSHLMAELKKRNYSNLTLVRQKDYDLRKPLEIERLFTKEAPEVVVHLAANVGGIGYNQENPGKLFYDNAIMGIELIEQARQFQVQKMVVLGTVCAYPKYASIPFHEEELWTGFPEETNAPYGLAKKMLLTQLQAYREQYDFNGIYLMPVNLYGPKDNFDPRSSHIIPALIRKCVEAKEAKKDHIVLWGDGTATREFLFVEDAALGIALALEHYDEKAPINLGSGREISIAQLAKTVAKLVGFSGKMKWDTTKPNGQPRRCLNVDKANQKFGFRAQTELEEGLKKTIHWYLQHTVEHSSQPHISKLVRKWIPLDHS